MPNPYDEAANWDETYYDDVTYYGEWDAPSSFSEQRSCKRSNIYDMAKNIGDETPERDIMQLR
jgi:hypothetical protein